MDFIFRRFKNRPFSGNEMTEVSIISAKGCLERKVFDANLDWKSVEILTALQPDEQTKLSLLRAPLNMEVLLLDDKVCYVLHRSLYFNKPSEQKSKSPGSKAIYFACNKKEMHGLLLQYMPSFSITSKHYHELTSETYHNLEGECILEIDGKPVKLKNSTVTVQPYQVHQVRTKEQSALTLLSIHGDPKGLSMDDHHYV